MSGACLLASFLVFGLATFGVRLFGLGDMKTIALGLALLVAGLLLPGLRAGVKALSREGDA